MSDKKLQANRANSRKSPGPKTAASKARSSQNALTHGLSSQTPSIIGRDRRRFRPPHRGKAADEQVRETKPPYRVPDPLTNPLYRQDLYAITRQMERDAKRLPPAAADPSLVRNRPPG